MMIICRGCRERITIQPQDDVAVCPHCATTNPPEHDEAYSLLRHWPVLILLLFLALGSAHATVWHIRQDGGTATQCTGTTNAAYPGSGTGVACAYNHPWWMLNQSTGAWVSFTSGDTMEFDDPPTNTTPYYFGIGLNGLAPPVGSNAFCTGGAVNCVMPALPSGVNVFGQNRGSCHDSGHTHLVNPTIWSGLNGTFEVLNLQGAANVDIECIAITQPDTCTIGGGGSNTVLKTALASGTATYVTVIASGNNVPLTTQRVTVSGSTNGGGALNVINKNIATFTYSSWNITNSSATSTVLTLAYTVTSGDVPRVGQILFRLTGLTNAGGSYNTDFGNGTIATSSGTTSGTLTITGTFTPASSQAESGVGTDFGSGTSTITGIAGSASLATDTGTMVPAGQCVSGANNYVQHGVRFEYTVAQGPTNLTMKDFAVVGVGLQGFLGSKINQISTDVSTFSDIYVLGNGYAGWDSDGGGCGNSCESQGTMNLSHVDVEWNGCNAVKPYNFNVPAASNTFDLCYAQSTGGYGDGFAFIAANTKLNVDHSVFRNNTQDGFDGAHLADDLTQSPQENIQTSLSTGNMGQTFKLGAVTIGTAINNFSNGNCRFLVTASNAPSNPLGWNAGLQSVNDSCRAAGDEWAINVRDGAVITLQNNTSVGQGSTMYDMGCASPPSFNCSGATVRFANNISMGFVDPPPLGNGQVAASFFFGSGNLFSLPGSVDTHNLWFSMRNPSCPQESNETNCVFADPLFISESNVNTVNPHLQGGSPAISTGTNTGCPTTDFDGNPQTATCTKGAFVISGAPVLTSITVLPNPGSVVVGGTLNMQTNSFCTFSDSSTIAAGSAGCVVAWSSTSAHSSINSSTGIVTGSSVGSDTVTATLSPASPATATVNVVAAAGTQIRSVTITCGIGCVIQ